MKVAKITVRRENINTFWDTVTDERIELLRVIKEKSPESMYELVKLVGRDLKSVNTDLHVLEEYWLVSLEKSKEGRAKVKPQVSFDKLNIEIALA